MIIIVSFIDADATDGMVVAVKMAFEWMGIAAYGSVVTLRRAEAGIVVGEVVHQPEVIAAVVVACIHTGRQKIQLVGEVNLVRII